ncbi:MAG: M56 family metallopeptidase [Thalassotalea sp.]
MLETIINSVLFSTIALTLIHFLWQGLAVAVLLKSALMITPKQHSRLRYSFASFAMLINLLLPFLTFAILFQPDYFSDLQHSSIASSDILGLSLLAQESSLSEEIIFLLPYLTIAWLSAVLCLAGKMIVQMISVNQLPKQRIAQPFTELNARFNELVHRLKINKAPELVVSMAIDVPMAIGWLKPVVLLPAAMVTGLTPAQLDMLLLHELAHIRRHDYLVNLIQSLVEIILFFHPAVFWVSKQMRIEREYCSDDIAVQHCGDALAYAHTLTDTASLCNKHRHAIPAMAMAASGGDLKERVLRLVNHHSCTTTYDKSKWLASVIIVTSFLILSSKELAQLNYLDMSSHSAPSVSTYETGDTNIENYSNTTYLSSSNTSAAKKNTLTENASLAQATTVNVISSDTVETTEQLPIKEIDVLSQPLAEPINQRVKPITSAILTGEKNNAFVIEQLSNENIEAISTITDNTTVPSKTVQPSSNMQTEITVKKTVSEQAVAVNKPAAAKVLTKPKNLVTQASMSPTKAAIKSPVQTLPSQSTNLTTSAAKLETINELPNIKKRTGQVTNPYQQELTALNEPTVHQDAITKFEQKNPLARAKNIAKKLMVAPEVIFKSAEIINLVDPKYPSSAQRKKVEQDLLVNFSISKDGLVKNIQIEKKNKSSYFKNSIIKAMEQWRFQPAQENGKPVESTMSKIFSFNLSHS